MKKKINKKVLIYIALSSVFLLSFILPGSYTGNMFGKCYDSKKDFICCKENKLILHHFYMFHLFWADATTGYDEEIIGKKTKEDCNFQCAE